MWFLLFSTLKDNMEDPQSLIKALQAVLAPAIQASVGGVEQTIKQDITSRDSKLAGQTNNLSVLVSSLSIRLDQMAKDLSRQVEIGTNVQKTILDKFAIDDRTVSDLLGAIEGLGRSLQTQNLQIGEFMRQQEVNSKQAILVTDSLKKTLADLKDKSVVGVLKKQVADLQGFQRELLQSHTGTKTKKT